MNMTVTRFAPSPTGFLHIGGARTALFNKIYSASQHGKFLLRIEDTDKERSTDAAIKAITDGLLWLGIKWDEEIVFQSKNIIQHRNAAEELLDLGKAYKCYLTVDDISNMKKDNPHAKIISPWREGLKIAPLGAKFSVRLKAEMEGVTTIHDSVQGEVAVHNSQLDDLVLLRSDGTPTYMLAVVVDDHNMGITDIIRGDDHLTNTFRQLQIYKALNWLIPNHAHIPLIHGADGAKLSKRHGALGIEEYKKMGYFPEAICSYLMTLGWSSGDDGVIDMEAVARAFKLQNIGRAPARIDFDKLNFVNGYYLNKKEDEEILRHTLQALNIQNDEMIAQRLMLAMPDIKVRSKTITEVSAMACLYIAKSKKPDAQSLDILSNYDKDLLYNLRKLLSGLTEWSADNIKCSCEAFAQEQSVKIGLIMRYLRAFLLGDFNSPGIWNVMAVLGQKESLDRMQGD